MQTSEEMKREHRSFAIIMRGDVQDFLELCAEARASGLFIVYTKSSHMKLEVREVPF